MDLNSCLSLIPDGFPRGAVSVDEPVEPMAVEQYRRWLDAGCHGEMAYLENYLELRADPRTLLEGARTLIAVGFPYYTEERMELPISLYARGRDYHEVVREYLTDIASGLPGESRVCVDTAPLRERYWACRAGLGFIGKNNQLIVPGLGSYFFLGFILNTTDFGLPVSAEPVADGCVGCRRCVDACPGCCLSADGSGVDARRCLSYMTIEYRGELPEGLNLPVLYGCDVCQRVCPHNAGARPTTIVDFRPSEALAALTADKLASMTPDGFRALFRHSAIRRAKLTGLLRNLRQLRRGAGAGSSAS